MTYSYGSTPNVLTPQPTSNWASESWTLNPSLTTSTHVYYDATSGSPDFHYPARIAINYSAGTTANTQIWETATGTNYNGSALTPYLQISSSTGGSGSSTATYTGPNGTPSNVVTFNKVLITVTSNFPGTQNVNVPYVTWNFPHLSCGDTTYVSVTHTAATSYHTTYTLHDDTGQIGTILVGTGATATANTSFIISDRWLYVKDPTGATIGAKHFSCKRKVHCNFW